MENRELIIERCIEACACDPQFKRLWEAKTEQQFWQVLIDNMLWVCIKDILIGINIPLEYQIAAVTKFGCAIEYIKDPSESVQLAAVTQCGYAIKYITNPIEAVQLAAVKQNPYAILYITDPSEEVKKLAYK